MDIKVINLDKNKLLQTNNYSDQEKDKYLKQALYPALGLKIIVEDYQLTDEINDKIDYLCLDESYRLVIVEKRYGKNTRVIKSGLLFIDYIRENISKIKILISDILGSNVLKEICFDCRLVILTESFSSFDYSSIKYLPYNIEAINYAILEKNIAFVKEYHNMSKDYRNYKGLRNRLYNELEDFLLSLGDEVSLFGNMNIITARKIRPFLYILIKEEDIVIFLNNNKYVINNMKELENIEKVIEKAYDER